MALAALVVSGVGGLVMTLAGKEGPPRIKRIAILAPLINGIKDENSGLDCRSGFEGPFCRQTRQIWQVGRGEPGFLKRTFIAVSAGADANEEEKGPSAATEMGSEEGPRAINEGAMEMEASEAGVFNKATKGAQEIGVIDSEVINLAADGPNGDAVITQKMPLEMRPARQGIGGTRLPVRDS